MSGPRRAIIDTSEYALTLTASSAEAALQLLDRHTQVDVLFTDIVMPGAMNGRELAKLARLKRPELKVEGPIQYDAAVDAHVASLKLPDSEVAGRATVFIFPDLDTGNVAYKAVQRSAGVVAIGPVLQGLRKPINDLSRGCHVVDIVNTVTITAIQAQAEN